MTKLAFAGGSSDNLVRRKNSRTKFIVNLESNRILRTQNNDTR